MKAQRGSRQIAPLSNLGARGGWVVNAKPRPLYHRGRDPVPIGQKRLGGPQGRSGRVRKISPTPGFFSFDPYCTFKSFRVLHVTLCSILLSLYNQHNTNIHASGGIRTHNPSKRAAADPRLRQRGHWYRLGFDPRTVERVASRYTDYAIPAHVDLLHSSYVGQFPLHVV